MLHYIRTHTMSVGGCFADALDCTAIRTMNNNYNASYNLTNGWFIVNMRQDKLLKVLQNSPTENNFIQLFSLLTHPLVTR